MQIITTLNSSPNLTLALSLALDLTLVSSVNARNPSFPHMHIYTLVISLWEGSQMLTKSLETS